MKKLLFILALVICLPLSVHAEEEASCTVDPLCTCSSVTEGTETFTSVTTASTCNDKCATLDYDTYDFQCNNIPEAAGEVDTTIVQDISQAIDSAKGEYIPSLNVPIPGLDLENSVSTDERGNITTNAIGLYVNAVFKYGIIIAAIFGVFMLSIAGFQYMTAGGSKKGVTQAKERIQNSMIGLILIMACYSIAFLIDPRTTRFSPISLQNVSEIKLDEHAAGDEGSGTSGGSGSWLELSEPYRSIVDNAKDKVTCEIPDLLSSPTGNLPNQGRHHWYDRGRDGNYLTISALDWAARWGSEIYAPFAGTVSYKQQTNTSNKCGNRIYLRSSNGEASITICHAKDFTNASGVVQSGRVEKGNVIGHVGGLCCSGQDDAYEVTQCNVAGTMCTNPFSSQSCSCQRITEAGNTTGPHVHITYDNMPGGMLLACLE